MNITELEHQLKLAFSAEGLNITRLESRQFPHETHLLVFVAPEYHPQALQVASRFEPNAESDEGIFVIVRKASAAEVEAATPGGRVKSVHDPRCEQLIKLVSAHNRVSDAQPSLAYVADARASISAVSAARHHLIFGRRGAGKTALMVQAKGQLEAAGAITAWANIQTYRREESTRVVLYVLNEMLRSIQAARVLPAESDIALRLAKLSTDVQGLIDAPEPDERQVTKLVPRSQQVLRDALGIIGSPLYVFLDDFYYLERQKQPLVLDLLHGAARDVNAWLKVASIRHLTKWWQASPPVGLQSGQDADLIDLDITLQDPTKAKVFLEQMLLAFAKRAGIGHLSQVFLSTALDRLVIASGAVPRDYLVLATNALAQARRRESAKLVGVQDVNIAAGAAGAAKKQELEEDMAASAGASQRTLETLASVRKFCLDDRKFSYFLVDLREREEEASAYTRLTDLLDVRLVHMIEPSVSDAHEAGRKYEAFMLDLSEYSGSRLKHGLRALDFVDGKFQTKETGTSAKPKVARTPREFTTILRTAPVFSLKTLSP